MTVENEFQKKLENITVLRNNFIYKLESFGFFQTEDKTTTFKKFIKDNICFIVVMPFDFKMFRLELKLDKGYHSRIYISRLMTIEDLFNAVELISDNLFIFECILENMSGNIKVDFDYFPRHKTYKISDIYGRKMYLSINECGLSLHSKIDEPYTCFLNWT